MQKKVKTLMVPLILSLIFMLTACPFGTTTDPDTSLIEGTEGDDVLVGDAQVNKFKGFGGNDRMVLNGGNDIADGGLGTDTVELSENKDSYAFTENTDGSVRATDGNDIITFNSVEEVEFADGSTETVENLIDDVEEPVVDPDPVVSSADINGDGIITVATDFNDSSAELRPVLNIGLTCSFRNTLGYDFSQFQEGDKTYKMVGNSGDDRIEIYNLLDSEYESLADGCTFITDSVALSIGGGHKESSKNKTYYITATAPTTYIGGYDIVDAPFFSDEYLVHVTGYPTTNITAPLGAKIIANGKDYRFGMD